MKIDSTAYLVWPSWAKQEEQKAYKLMKLYSILLNEKLVKTEIKKEIKYFLKLNKKQNIIKFMESNEDSSLKSPSIYKHNSSQNLKGNW